MYQLLNKIGMFYYYEFSLQGYTNYKQDISFLWHLDVFEKDNRAQIIVESDATTQILKKDAPSLKRGSSLKY